MAMTLMTTLAADAIVIHVSECAAALISRSPWPQTYGDPVRCCSPGRRIRDIGHEGHPQAWIEQDWPRVKKRRAPEGGPRFYRRTRPAHGPSGTAHLERARTYSCAPSTWSAFPEGLRDCRHLHRADPRPARAVLSAASRCQRQRRARHGLPRTSSTSAAYPDRVHLGQLLSPQGGSSSINAFFPHRHTCSSHRLAHPSSIRPNISGPGSRTIRSPTIPLRTCPLSLAVPAVPPTPYSIARTSFGRSSATQDFLYTSDRTLLMHVSIAERKLAITTNLQAECIQLN